MAIASCGDEFKSLGSDPKLNVSSYTFSKEGGMLKVFSTNKQSLMLFSKGSSATAVNDIYGTEVDGKWFTANVKHYQADTIYIKVEPNVSGEQRTLGIDIMSGDYRCSTSFVQSGK